MTAADGEKSEEERRSRNRENRGEDKQNNIVKEDKQDVFVTGKVAFNPRLSLGFSPVLTDRMWKSFMT